MGRNKKRSSLFAVHLVFSPFLRVKRNPINKRDTINAMMRGVVQIGLDRLATPSEY